MEKIKLIITARIEEVPTIVNFTLDAMNFSMVDLVAYKPMKYTPAFSASLETKRDEINAIVYPVVLTAELKVITIHLIGNVIGMRQTMNLLQGYVNDASGLTVGKADFGIKEVKKKVGSRDVEGLDGALSVVLTNITNNMAALVAVGYTPAMKTALVATKNEIKDDNTSQNKKMQQRSELVKNNITKINDLLTDIKGIWADGKILYGISDKERAKYFTNADIIRRIRNDELHTVITGKVFDKNGALSPAAKIVARPSTEGKRGRTVTSDANGVYTLKGLRPINFILTVTLKSGGVFMTNADAVTNETVVVDLHEPV